MSDSRAWAAGLFEGEGCFHVRRPNGGRRSVHLHAALLMTDEAVVRAFAAIMEVGSVNVVRPRLPHHRVQYAWRVNGADVERAYALLCPWLSERRCAQYERCLAARLHYEAERNAARSPGGRIRYCFTQGRLP